MTFECCLTRRYHDEEEPTDMCYPNSNMFYHSLPYLRDLHMVTLLKAGK